MWLSAAPLFQLGRQDTEMKPKLRLGLDSREPNVDNGYTSDSARFQLFRPPEGGPWATLIGFSRILPRILP